MSKFTKNENKQHFMGEDSENVVVDESGKQTNYNNKQQRNTQTNTKLSIQLSTYKTKNNA